MNKGGRDQLMENVNGKPNDSYLAWVGKKKNRALCALDWKKTLGRGVEGDVLTAQMFMKGFLSHSRVLKKEKEQRRGNHVGKTLKKTWLKEAKRA